MRPESVSVTYSMLGFISVLVIVYINLYLLLCQKAAVKEVILVGV